MSFLVFVFRAVEIIIIVDAISSWFAKPNQFPRSITGPLTEPLYAPIRKLLGSTSGGGVDWAPLILLVALNVLVGVFMRGI